MKKANPVRRDPAGRQARICAAMTLTEMVMAMALLSAFFAVLLPQFRILHRSWGLKEASAEILQNGRVLLDHMQSHLSCANTITAVSAASEPLGHIEYRDADGDVWRYEVQEDGWVVFGPAGSPAPLAGPVSRFQIAGYAPQDPETTVSDPAAMRLLRIQAAFADPKGIGRTREFAASVFVRAEGRP